MSGEDLTLDVTRQGVVTCVDASKSLLQEDDLVMKVCEVPWDLSLLESLRGGSKSVNVQRITLYVHEKVPKLKKKRSLPTYVSWQGKKLVLRVRYDNDEHILALGFPEDEAESMSVLAKAWLAKSHQFKKAQEVPDTEYKPGSSRSLPTYVSWDKKKLVLRVVFDDNEHILARGFPEDEAESMSVLAKAWLAKSHLSEKAQEVPDTEYKPGPPRKKRKREQAPQAV
mmetsp:Transcript_76571/g.219682  ORF Transcript_76571/g.219682 Transcript_76571/m.219682 type:complete len:226 (-) Transcript_76571:8-685(-)